ncbi:MAG: 16S rRNA processing protein RimM [Atopobiaceae bacterium]|nr:16S rRNA processing protein RimM [Atopobiaceae bacterium]
MAEAYRSIARIQKTHGRNGEVVAVPTHGLPLLLHEGLEVTVVPPELKGPRRHVVSRCVDAPAGQLVAFADVRSLGEASRLVGKTVLARMADLPADVALHDVDALAGRMVRDVRHGPLGAIEEVLRGPANDVWVVRGRYGEVLVPVVEAMIREFDESGDILVDLPDGLVDEGAACE